MAEKKKGKQRKVGEEKPTKEEYAVAKYLRFNLPVREGKLHGMEVKCFFGNAAVDKLLESKWSASKKSTDALFTNRVSCVAYLVRLLEKGLFLRAEREKKKKDKDKPKKKKKGDKEGEKEETAPAEEELRERKGKKDKRGKKEKEGETAADEEAEKKSEKKDDKKKKEKRLKLNMSDEQFFEDGEEVYVWIYDPVNAKNFLIGLLMVLGAIALCMFPLWPEAVRIGVYYLSLAAAGFVGFILSLVVIRLILFCCIWVLTFGRHHFWFLPNLTEDVGFFDSFRPLYKHDAVSKSDDSKSGDGSKKKKKEKKEEEKELRVSEKKEKSSDKEDSDEFELIKKEDLDQNGANDEEDDGENDNDYDDNEGDDDRGLDEDEDDINADDNGDTEDDDDEEEESNSEAPVSETKKTK